MKVEQEQQKTSRLWNEVYADIDGRLFPHEQLIKYLFFIKQHKYFDELSVLDIGFGTAANLLGCHRLGYRLSGIEVSKNSLDKTCQTFEEMGIEFEGKLFNPPAIPFQDDSFSLLYSNQCCYYNLKFSEFVKETYRVLRPGGAFYHTFFTPNQWYFKHAEILPGGFARWSQTHPTHQLRGMQLRYFSSKDELYSEFGIFEGVRVDTLTTDFLGVPFELWIVTGQKDGARSKSVFDIESHYGDIKGSLSMGDSIIK